MKLIDSHTHLYLQEFDKDRKEIIDRALNNGVEKMLLPNIDASTIEDMLEMTRDYKGICYPMAGLHPTSVRENFHEELSKIESYLQTNSLIAIGEIGMDLYWDKTFKEEQVKAFETQIGWAKSHEIPVVIHCRDAFKEIYEVLDSSFYNGMSGVFHSFTGTKEDVKKIREYDFYFGINGIVTFPNSNLPEIVKEIPVDRILVETDSPFLSPVPKRGKRNESANIVFIAEKLAEIYGLDPDKFKKQTISNTMNLFNKLNDE